MKLIILIYRSLQNNEDKIKEQLLNLLSDDYKKVVYSKMNITVDLDAINQNEIKQILKNDKVRENINKIIWYLYENE